MEGEANFEDLRRMVFESLVDRRYYIVLDDVWRSEFWHRMTNLFPNNGSQLLLTTRLQQVAEIVSPLTTYRIRFLDKKESWDLLRQKVFLREELCSYQLQESGKKIAENCEGLPLTIIKVAEILSKVEKTTEYWNTVAADKQHPVFVDAYEKMYKVLYPSYDYLPQHLKVCFLYMGIFSQSFEIQRSKLVKLWTVEGFLQSTYSSLDEILENLVSSSLVIVHQKSLVMKTFGLNSAIWHLCNKVAGKTKFFRGLSNLADGLAEEGLKSQRRLSIRNSVLFGIRDVYDSMASISTVRSLLCTGLYHQYQVPVCLEYLSLLRILDALAIRFYEFPKEVVNLVQLSYLALTFDGEIPASISTLWNLHYLIVRQHTSIIESDGNSPYLPMDIWDMTELNHLQVKGSNLPKPCEGSLLPYLFTLLDVSAQSCTRDVLESIPYLRKLGVRIELVPDNDDEPMCFFDHISHVRILHTLKCIIVNPKIMSWVTVSPPAPLSTFPSSLVKLTLSGLGYPWEEMSKISSLPNLQVLKLRCFAFRGPKWEVDSNEFPCLEYLLIEDTDLVHWTSQDYYLLRQLKRLSIKHCYKLQEIPLEFGGSLEKIELVDCNPLALNCANKLKEDLDLHNPYGKLVDLHVLSSWDI